tara:strand:+ start:2210 stop:3166 length:957 start_codon:yes stop_codon:yes gene_type:complete
MIIIENDVSTSAIHGCHPSNRSIEQLLESGFFLLDKAPGPSSHQVSAWARDLLGLEKMGHGGTLDPFATGVLPLLCGKAMRLTSRILTHDKSYIALLKLGGMISREALEEKMNMLKGKVYNVPPEISAVKVQVRTRKIMDFEILDIQDKLVLTRITCEAGTYVRTMARDLGLLINMKVELKELRRPSSGEFSLENSITMQQLSDANWLWKERGDTSAMEKILHPIENMLADVPRIVVKDGAAAAISHGAPLLRPGVVSLDGNLGVGSEVLIVTIKGEAVALAEMLQTSKVVPSMTKGEVAHPKCVLMKEDTYPRSWKG